MPKKRGRFIPCRGGGTTTTYYTDYHNVDEDMVTLTYLGESWSYSTRTGLMRRDVDASPAAVWDIVASRLIYLS